MYFLTALTLMSIGVAAYAVSRSLLFPPVVLAGVWATAFVLLILSGDLFYRVNDLALFIYTAGALAFAVGGTMSVYLDTYLGLPKPPRVPRERTAAWLTNLVIVVMVLAFPLYWRELQAAMLFSAVDNVFMAARLRAVGRVLGLAPELPFFLRNLIQLALVFTLIAFHEARPTAGWRIRCSLIFTLTLVYQLLTGARAGAIFLVVGVLALSWIKAGRVRLAPLIPGIAIFLVAFGLIAVQLETGTVRRDLGIRRNLPAMVEALQMYAVGGIVAFREVAEDPDVVPSTGGILRTAKEMANRFGADYEIPSLHAEFRPVGDHISINVFTMYFFFLPDFGIPGSLFFLWILGIGTGLVYVLAVRGSPVGRIFYAILFVGIAETIFSETILTNTNLLAKTALLLLIVYGLSGARPADSPQSEVVAAT